MSDERACGIDDCGESAVHRVDLCQGHYNDLVVGRADPPPPAPMDTLRELEDVSHRLGLT